MLNDEKTGNVALVVISQLPGGPAVGSMGFCSTLEHLAESVGIEVPEDTWTGKLPESEEKSYFMRFGDHLVAEKFVAYMNSSRIPCGFCKYTPRSANVEGTELMESTQVDELNDTVDLVGDLNVPSDGIVLSVDRRHGAIHISDMNAIVNGLCGELGIKKTCVGKVQLGESGSSCVVYFGRELSANRFMNHVNGIEGRGFSAQPYLEL